METTTDRMFLGLGLLILLFVMSLPSALILMIFFDMIHGYYPAVAPFSFWESFLISLTIGTIGLKFQTTKT